MGFKGICFKEMGTDLMSTLCTLLTAKLDSQKITSEAQTSKMELFVKAVNYFYKKLHLRCLIGLRQIFTIFLNTFTLIVKLLIVVELIKK